MMPGVSSRILYTASQADDVEVPAVAAERHVGRADLLLGLRSPTIGRFRSPSSLPSGDVMRMTPGPAPLVE